MKAGALQVKKLIHKVDSRQFAPTNRLLQI